MLELANSKKKRAARIFLTITNNDIFEKLFTRFYVGGNKRDLILKKM